MSVYKCRSAKQSGGECLCVCVCVEEEVGGGGLVVLVVAHG